MHFADLAPCTYFGQWEELLLAVGWLERGHSFETGTVSKRFFSTLMRHLTSPWEPVTMVGWAFCNLCQFAGGPGQMEFEGDVVTLGAANLFLPAEDKILVAPSLIAHYIDAHNYCPPRVFQEAVLRCPEMGSRAYLDSIRALGLLA